MDDVAYLEELVTKLRRDLQDSRHYAQKNKDLFEKAKDKIRQLLEKIRQRDAVIVSLKSRISLDTRDSMQHSVRNQIEAKLRFLRTANDELEMDIEGKERQLEYESNERFRKTIVQEIECKKEFLIQQKENYTELAAKARVDFESKNSDTSDDMWDMNWSQISPVSAEQMHSGNGRATVQSRPDAASTLHEALEPVSAEQLHSGNGRDAASTLHEVLEPVSAEQMHSGNGRDATSTLHEVLEPVSAEQLHSDRVLESRPDAASTLPGVSDGYWKSVSGARAVHGCGESLPNTQNDTCLAYSSANVAELDLV